MHKEFNNVQQNRREHALRASFLKSSRNCVINIKQHYTRKSPFKANFGGI